MQFGKLEPVKIGADGRVLSLNKCLHKAMESGASSSVQLSDGGWTLVTRKRNRAKSSRTRVALTRTK